MSLRVFIKQKDLIKDMEFIENNDALFDYDLYKGMKISKTIQNIMKLIDHADYVGDMSMETRFGFTSMENLSTGCKTIINIINHQDKIISCGGCGDNALQEIIKLKEGNVYLYNLPSNQDGDIDIDIDLVVITDKIEVVKFYKLSRLYDFWCEYVEV